MRGDSSPGAMAPPWPTSHPYGNERLWLDCLLEREILRLRGRYELSLDELRGLYVSDRQVDELLLRHEQELAGGPYGSGPAAALTGQAQQWRAHFAADSPLELLGQRLVLTDTELELLLVAFAPELDLRYETLYAYLNNDITRKHATLDLACRLLGGSQPDQDRVRACAHALAAQGILDLPDRAERRSSLGLGLHLAPVLVQFLLGLAPAASRVRGGAPPGRFQWESVECGSRSGAAAAHGELLVCRGDDRERLEGWASTQLGARARHGLHLQPAALADESDPILLARAAGAALVLHEPCSIAGEAAADERLAALLARALEAGLDVLWLAPRDWQAGPACAALAPAVLDLAPASTAQRLRDWEQALRTAGLPGIDMAASAPGLAARYSFGPARIRHAVAGARALREADPACRDPMSALERSARRLAAQPLARVAQMATRPHDWSQLVLPATTLALLREVAAALRCRRKVYHDWCMQRRTGRSAGLMLLFAGASGTGKTMAASVLANHVGLDLFRIDLAGVISKYIGETEKNLDRIFRAASDADALLLFDEADALLGKRAEVKDAHDRYANIEVAYLLQKMEEHDGVVILASNLPKNLDQAFSRRMHYVVEFARPGPLLREQLWRGIFPPEVPLAADIDYAFLAAEFDLTGGDIQTIALEAAFQAADEEAELGMRQLVRALARRQTKHGDPGAAARYRAHQDSAGLAP